MDFLDEDDRQAAIRVGRRAVVRAVAALAGTVGAPLVALNLAPLVGLLVAVAALGLAVSSLMTLRHPQASVIGGLRVLGLALGGTVVLIGALEAAFATKLYLEWRDRVDAVDRAEQRVH